MKSGCADRRGIFPSDKAKKCRNTWCIPNFFNAVWRKKNRRDACKDFIGGYEGDALRAYSTARSEARRVQVLHLIPLFSEQECVSRRGAGSRICHKSRSNIQLRLEV